MAVEKINIIGDLSIEVVRASVAMYALKDGSKYAKVQKSVPKDWVGEEVIIMRKSELDKIIKNINGLLYVIGMILSNEEYKKQLVESMRKVKLRKDGIEFKT